MDLFYAIEEEVYRLSNELPSFYDMFVDVADINIGSTVIEYNITTPKNMSDSEFKDYIIVKDVMEGYKC